MNQVCSVLVTEDGVVLIQQFNNVIPSIPFIVYNVIAIHVHIEFYPVHIFLQFYGVWEQENIIETIKQTFLVIFTNATKHILWYLYCRKVILILLWKNYMALIRTPATSSTSFVANN